ncbi:MAG: lysophospholipid acyltransferase family protein [Bdellovibrionota bacterium]
MLSRYDKIGLWAQRQLSRALIPCSYYFAIIWMRLARRYRIPALKAARREFRRLRREANGPLVICGNHLTAVDSLLIMWALSPGWRAFLRPSLMPWNLPDKANFSGNIYIRMLCYIGRCLPIVRRGPREEVRRVLDKVQALLHRGDSILIFPEGGRSRIGRVDTENFSYGVGTILQECPEASVLCVFFRGRHQKEFSNLPHRGDQFDIDLRLIHPRSESAGLRGARDISTQIVHELAAMEQRHFAREAPLAGQ